MANMKDPRYCEICGAEFMPKSPTQKICGSAECKQERHRRYVREHAEMYRMLNREYRKKAENKVYRAEYDREYQNQHKQKIKAYKRSWWLKKNFQDKLQRGILLENVYWFSLSKDEQNKYKQQLEEILNNK